MIGLLLDGCEGNTGIDHIRDAGVFEGIELELLREAEGGTDHITPVGCELAGTGFPGARGEVVQRVVSEQVVAGVGEVEFPDIFHHRVGDGSGRVLFVLGDVGADSDELVVEVDVPATEHREFFRADEAAVAHQGHHEVRDVVHLQPGDELVELFRGEQAADFLGKAFRLALYGHKRVLFDIFPLNHPIEEDTEKIGCCC